nr:hypothetical protein [Tanacetum cinerariifolium]
MGDDVDINTLTLEQYMALIQDNIRPGIAKPKIDSDVKFEINGNFMRELRLKLLKAEDDEWIKKFIKNTDLNIRALKTTTNNLQEKADQLTQTVLANTSKRVKSKTKIGKSDMKEPVPHNLPIEHPYEEPTPFPGRLKGQKGKDVERLSQMLTPTIHTLPNLEPVVQPYMPLSPFRDKANVAKEEELDTDIPLQDGMMQPVTAHITPLGDVASATIPILDKHLNEFGEDFSDITKVVEMRDGNPINDVKRLSELIKTDDFKTFIQKLVHRVSQSSYETEVHFNDGKIPSFPVQSILSRKKMISYLINYLVEKGVDAFACPVSFPWHTDKNISKDPLPKSTKFNVDDYAILMDLFAFIHVVDPTKVEIIERERGSASSGGHNAEIELATDVEDIAAKNVTAERPKCQCKKRPAVTDASGSSHPFKKLRGITELLVGFVLKELLASIIMSVEVGVIAVATLPFITSSISSTPEHEGGDHTDSVNGPNLCTIGLVKVMIKAVVTSHAVSAPFILILETKTKITSLGYASIFYESGSTEQRGQMLRNVLNDALLDDSDVSWEFVDHLAPPALFSQIRKMDYHHVI